MVGICDIAVMKNEKARPHEKVGLGAKRYCA
jgi:hypothetical protein